MKVEKICVIGLGYVGLPLAMEFSKHFEVVGFDISQKRVSELMGGYDSTGEVSIESLNKLRGVSFTTDAENIKGCNVYIITVPTPIDSSMRPDLGPLISASKLVGSVLKQNDVVIYESTVYPGATEDDCVPVLEQVSGLKYNSGFFVGYSPERINPGDKQRPVNKIIKVTSGSNAETANFIDELYLKIIEVGTFKASSIRVAEASKIIENTQRDVNIALINELSIVFDHMNINTFEVLAAASTKWNFINLKPGLVGGHCIGVDPYYLLQKSISSGYVPDIIRTSREINDSMPKYYASQFVKRLINANITIKGSRVLILGFTFKENCPDIRNTKVYDLIIELEEYGFVVDVCDPWADPQLVKAEYGVELVPMQSLSEKLTIYQGYILSVAHSEFKPILRQVYGSVKNVEQVFDLKNLTLDAKE